MTAGQSAPSYANMLAGPASPANPASPTRKLASQPAQPPGEPPLREAYGYFARRARLARRPYACFTWSTPRQAEVTVRVLVVGSRSTWTVSPSVTWPDSRARASGSPTDDCTSRRSGRAP